MKYVSLTCGECGKEFQKAQDSRYRKALVRGQVKFYCCRHCSMMAHNPPKEYITLICVGCGKGFQRLQGQHNYNIRRGQKAIQCSRGCRSRQEPQTSKRKRTCTGEPYIKEHSPFRLFIHKAKGNSSRRRKLAFDITPGYLKEIFDIQNGICPLSGWALRIPASSQKWEKGYAYSIDNASLDRIDNSKGYIKGNVRFVALITNFARNQFTDEEVIKFGRAVVEHNSLRQVA